MIGPNTRRFVLAGAALGVLGLGAWLVLHRCGGLLGCDTEALPRGPVTYDQVKSHPEGHLYYPGAHVYWEMGGAEHGNPIEGVTNPAFSGAILTSYTSTDEIYAWYRQWLFSHGWQLNDKAIGATIWVSYQGFKRGSRERFTLAVDDPKGLTDVLGTRVPTDRGTVLEGRYQILPASS